MSKLSVLKRVVFVIAAGGLLFSIGCDVLTWLLPNLLSLAT